MEQFRYFLHLSYKGTNYNGWQIQPNGITVQGEINKVLSLLNSNLSVKCMGCGRTDTGVHASKFYAHFDFPEIKDLKQFLFKINNMLPADIVIHDIINVAHDKHARFDAVSRTYQYHISKEKNAFNIDTSLKLNQKLDIKLMNEACEILKSNNDFECFSKIQTEVNNFNCAITEAYWTENDSEYLFTITANRFLRNMVRSIVGTIISIGNKETTLTDLQNIIDSKNRANAGKSVSANGLFLTDIKYNFDI